MKLSKFLFLAVILILLLMAGCTKKILNDDALNSVFGERDLTNPFEKADGEQIVSDVNAEKINTSNTGEIVPGSITENSDTGDVNNNTTSGEVIGNSENLNTASDFYPLITSTYLSPSNPSLGQGVNLEVYAEDDLGLKEIYWESANSFSNYSGKVSYDCQLQKTCMTSWELITAEEGTNELNIRVVDSTDHVSESKATIEVGPYREIKPSEPEVIETPEVVEPEPVVVPAEEECTSNSDCGYKQLCRSNKCIDVDCTNDAQCSSHKRCSYNSCVTCPKGPYGYTC
ncbi:MAG: hypothetical protein Q7K42_04835 [Candidatus Diapherotrites archaeon]|nr:hypothetical protein [Candidatus Diapherotrites archaeon]